MQKIEVSEVNIIPINLQKGLVAFASCVIDNKFFVGNIAIYTSPTTKEGFRLVFPNKKLASGQVLDCFHPITKFAEEQITSAIVKKYLELMDNFKT